MSVLEGWFLWAAAVTGSDVVEPVRELAMLRDVWAHAVADRSVSEMHRGRLMLQCHWALRNRIMPALEALAPDVRAIRLAEEVEAQAEVWSRHPTLVDYQAASPILPRLLAEEVGGYPAAGGDA